MMMIVIVTNHPGVSPEPCVPVSNVGFIQMLFPNALILHIAREPMDTVFSAYKHEFPSGPLDYSSAFESLADMYRGKSLCIGSTRGFRSPCFLFVLTHSLFLVCRVPSINGTLGPCVARPNCPYQIRRFGPRYGGVDQGDYWGDGSGLA